MRDPRSVAQFGHADRLFGGSRDRENDRRRLVESQENNRSRYARNDDLGLARSEIPNHDIASLARDDDSGLQIETELFFARPPPKRCLGPVHMNESGAVNV